MSESGPVGRIFQIQRFSIHDGPGIRTTVFFQGCPLRCRWCHNPEGLSSETQISLCRDRCVACGACIAICPTGAHRLVEGRHEFDHSLCNRCGACMEECPTDALKMADRVATVDEVLKTVLRDRNFYRSSGGGLTLSGGEPTRQIDFAAALLHGAKTEGLHCAVETCLYCDFQRLERILPDVDLWLCDWKETDREKHEAFTGRDNALIRENLLRLDETGASILLRCPLIPGLNDRRDHLRGIAELSRLITHLAGVELLPYHRIGAAKAERLGLDVAACTARVPSQGEMRGWHETLREAECAGLLPM